jgi:topoisomerase-4 subunit A
MMRRRIIKEIETDAKQYGDDRRTLIQEERRAAAEVKIVDEPVTVIVSQKGWVRTRQGHGHDATQFTFKAGDTLYDTFECRTTDALLIFGTRDDKGTGRVYSVAVANLPGGRGGGGARPAPEEKAPRPPKPPTKAGPAPQKNWI